MREVLKGLRVGGLPLLLPRRPPVLCPLGARIHLFGPTQLRRAFLVTIRERGFCGERKSANWPVAER